MMNRRTIVSRSVRFYSRTHIGVLLGCAISSAVLVGALFVGDSVHHSLEKTAIARLGKTWHSIDTGKRHFRSDLATRMA